MTPALFSLQDDAVKLARQITGTVETPPELIDAVRLSRLAARLSELAQLLQHHQARTPARLAELRKLAMGTYRSEPDPR